MGRYILKLDTPDGPRYLEWSTVVDAPVTYGMPLDEFKRYYRKAYRCATDSNLTHRLERVEQCGTSSVHHENARDVVAHNRAGKNETRLTYEQIVEFYCVRRAEDNENLPEGTSD